MNPRNNKAQPCGLGEVLDFIGADEKSRTPDLRITNALLYQLSYTGNFSALTFWSHSGERRILADDCDRMGYRATSTRYFSSNSGNFLATDTFFSVTYTGSPFLYLG